ncbi:MAG: tRNA pseudouridine(55) synthase TruB [Nitrospina sp.]|nr:tRNA pseudouridine(55) synthase TruB [Nitrospina sp.]
MSYTQNNVVNLFKPSGPTSFDMVWSVRKILGVKKAGHIGTLDPIADGVLPICLNRSTRIIQFLSSLQKTYRATLELGSETDTQDATGRVISTNDPSLINEAKMKQVFQTFVGEQDQVPPMYSAKKKNGIPLYKLARNGINIHRDPVKIVVYSIDFIKKERNQVIFEVRCSSGTYIRTLSHDIGKKLGCCAHMVRLTRTKVGLFSMGSTMTLEELKTAHKEGSLSRKLLHLEEVLNFLPTVRVKEEYLKSISHGVALSKCFLEALPDRFEPGHYFRVLGNNDKILAVVEPVVDQDKLSELTAEDVVFKAKRVLC